jgi:hypothetical protein
MSKLGFFVGGRLICIALLERHFFGTGSIRTARTISADSFDFRVENGVRAHGFMLRDN